MYNVEFQVSRKHFFKKRLSNLRGMNPIELSSVLLGKFGMQKKRLQPIPNACANINIMGNL